MNEPSFYEKSIQSFLTQKIPTVDEVVERIVREQREKAVSLRRRVIEAIGNMNSCNCKQKIQIEAGTLDEDVQTLIDELSSKKNGWKVELVKKGCLQNDLVISIPSTKKKKA